MREGLKSVVLEAIREKRVGWLLRHAVKFPTVWFASRWNLPPIGGPVLAGLCITHRCNERCLMCDLPMRAETECRPELSVDEWRRVIDDLAAHGAGSFSITGGEPLLRKDLPDLVARIRAMNLPVSVNSNGLLFNNEAVRRRFLERPPTAINISIDGADAETYERLRGCRGAWRTLLQAIEKLVRARDATPERFALNAVCVLSPDTLPQVRAVAALVESLGFDSLGFMPIQEIPSVNHHYGDAVRRLWTDEVKRAEVASVVDSIEWLLARQRRGEGIPLENSRAYLESVPLAFLGHESPSPCVTGHVNTFIGPYGDVHPCFPFQEWSRPPIGNVRDIPWSALWRSEAYGQSRRETRQCRACFWDCQLEENVMFAPPRVNGLAVARAELQRAEQASAQAAPRVEPTAGAVS